MQELQARNPPPRQSDVAISFPVMHSSSQYFPEMFETKDFVCFSAMPLFLCDVLFIVPASTSHLLSDTASVEEAQLDGCHYCSWDVPHKLQDIVLGKI